MRVVLFVLPLLLVGLQTDQALARNDITLEAEMGIEGGGGNHFYHDSLGAHVGADIGTLVGGFVAGGVGALLGQRIGNEIGHNGNEIMDSVDEFGFRRSSAARAHMEQNMNAGVEAN